MWYKKRVHLNRVIPTPHAKPYDFIKQRSRHGCFPVNFAKNFQGSFYEEHLHAMQSNQEYGILSDQHQRHGQEPQIYKMENIAIIAWGIYTLTVLVKLSISHVYGVLVASLSILHVLECPICGCWRRKALSELFNASFCV